MAEVDATPLQRYYARETNLFFKHLREAAAKFTETGELPKSLFPVKANKALEQLAIGKRKRKSKDSSEKRKPTVYNLFMKEKLEELKAGHTSAGTVADHQATFKQAVSNWTALSDEQKQQYAAKYAPIIAAAGAEAGGAGAATAAEEEATTSDESEEEAEVPVVVVEKHKKKKVGAISGVRAGWRGAKGGAAVHA